MPDAAETSTDTNAIYDNPDNTTEGEVREVNDSTADAEVKEPTAEVKESTEETAEAPKTEEKIIPEKYEYNQNEEANLDAADLEAISEYSKEKGFSQEEAQEYMEQQEAVISKYNERQQKSLDSMMETWESQVEADEEIGGESFNKNIELSKRVFQKFGSEELFNILNESRWGSNPEVVRFGVRLGKAMGEDSLLTGDNTPKTEKTMEEIFYGQ